MPPALPSSARNLSATRLTKPGHGACWHMAAAAVLLGASISSPHAAAQSAKSLKSAPTSPPPAAGTTASPAPKAGEPVTVTTPSRFVGPAELGSYVAAMGAMFSMKSRETDPFGQAQDPDAKPVIKMVAKTTQRTPQLQATPFADIVRLIVITTIMPKEKRFLVGTRSFAEGDRIPLTFRGKQIQIEVTQVSSREISFRNLDTGETATRKLDLLPPGMTPGNRGITAPGMVPDRPNAPLELEAGDAFTDNNPNR
jgi:hypothetical protein